MSSFGEGRDLNPFGISVEDEKILRMSQMEKVKLKLRQIPERSIQFREKNQWSTVFCGIISRAMTLEILSTRVVGNYNGALQVMTAEFQVPSPLVPTRENYFVRYCKQHMDGTWAVVDVSLDNLRPNLIFRSRRRTSGCVIQELPNGYSKVIWVEHIEVDDRDVHNIYRSRVNSGLASGLSVGFRS